MKQAYLAKRLSAASVTLIVKANEIFEDYAQQGYRLTLRQVYYQLVARDVIPNTLRSYKRLGGILNDARLVGLVDWDHIEDRGRGEVGNSHWDGPADILQTCAEEFRMNLWTGQPHRVWVMAEKDAVSSILEPVCRRLDVTFMANRGYCSQSAMKSIADTLLGYVQEGAKAVVLYFGDHDPSGIDMTRDVRDRLELFLGDAADKLVVERLALNMEQVEKYGPPPNPAKLTDSRVEGYIREFGHDSWELDALEPSVLTQLVERRVKAYRKQKLFNAMLEEQESCRAYLKTLAREAREGR